MDKNYIYVEYGGKCLSHYNFGINRIDMTPLIDCLSICANNFVVIDSDKRKHCDKLNETKLRIINQCGSDNTWVTWGKEIENYLPFKANKHRLKRYDSTYDIDNIFRDKVKYAMNAVHNINDRNWLNRTKTLEDSIKALLRSICSWSL